MKYFLTTLAILAAGLIGLWVLMERALWPRRSTREFWQLSDLSGLKKLEGYFYGVRTHWYLKPASWPWLLRYLEGRESADNYHGKVISRNDARRILTLNQPIYRENLDQVIPYPLARSLILSCPLPSLAVMDCACRAQKKDSCQPNDVCLVVGEPFASFVVDHQPGRARRVTVDEALDILDQEEKRGHIHTAWFKEVMHNRFYVICNCCSCCCLGMASYNRGVPRLIHSGYSPVLNLANCLSCNKCAAICPFRAWVSQADQPPRLEEEKCMGCGLCTSHCPAQALYLTLAPERGLPLNVKDLELN